MKRYFLWVIAIFLLVPAVTSAADDMCPMAAEFAAKATTTFPSQPDKALAGLIQANKWCPGDAAITYNLGQAYNLYKRPDKAYEVWSALAKKQPGDKTLINNLGWLAYKIGKYDDALSWAGKAGSSKKSAQLTLAVMYRKGEYDKALQFATANRSQAGDSEVDKAAGYVVEKQWQAFRAGNRESAAKSMMALYQKYPNVSSIQQAKDKIVMALWDDSVDIPLPKPLPDDAFGADMDTGLAYAATTSEVLAINKLKPTLTPSDDAYAVIVGVHQYQSINGPRFADNDAKQMQRMLTRLGGFKNDSTHIKLLLNRDATLGNILNSLNWLERNAKLHPEAKVVFYFSGHGSPVMGEDRTTIKDGLLIPYEANLDGLTGRTAISLAELDKRFAGIKNDNVVTIIDACFSGTGKSSSGMKLVKPRVDKKLLSSRKLFITASAADRPAEEYAPGRQGAFSYFFLKALMGDGDTNKDGWVDTMEAFTFAKSKLSALDLGQNPEITNNRSLKLSKVR